MKKTLITLALSVLLGLTHPILASPQVDTSQVPQFKVSSTAANDRAGQHGLCGRRSRMRSRAGGEATPGL
jgi:hypothetical protein